MLQKYGYNNIKSSGVYTIQSVKLNITKKLWKLQGLKDIHTLLLLEATSTHHGLLSWHSSQASYMARHISLMTVIMFQANILIFRKKASISKILFLALLCLLPAYTVIPVVQFASCSTFITLYECYDCSGVPFCFKWLLAIF